MAQIIFADAEVLADQTFVFGTADWSGALCHLTKVELNPTADTVLGDFLAVEADFNGYTPASAAPGFVGRFASSVLGIVTCFFGAADATNPNDIFDFFVTDASNTVLLAAGQIDQSNWPMAQAGDALFLFFGFTLIAGTVDTCPF